MSHSRTTNLNNFVARRGLLRSVVVNVVVVVVVVVLVRAGCGPIL